MPASLLASATPTASPLQARLTPREHEEMLSEARFNKPCVISVSQSPQSLIISTKRIEKHKGGLNLVQKHL